MLISASLVVFPCIFHVLNRLNGDEPTSSVLQRWPTVIHPNFMQFSSTYFCLAVTQRIHLVQD